MCYVSHAFDMRSSRSQHIRVSADQHDGSLALPRSAHSPALSPLAPDSYPRHTTCHSAQHVSLRAIATKHARTRHPPKLTSSRCRSDSLASRFALKGLLSSDMVSAFLRTPLPDSLSTSCAAHANATKHTHPPSTQTHNLVLALNSLMSRVRFEKIFNTVSAQHTHDSPTTRLKLTPLRPRACSCARCAFVRLCGAESTLRRPMTLLRPRDTLGRNTSCAAAQNVLRAARGSA